MRFELLPFLVGPNGCPPELTRQELTLRAQSSAVPSSREAAMISSKCPLYWPHRRSSLVFRGWAVVSGTEPL